MDWVLQHWEMYKDWEDSIFGFKNICLDSMWNKISSLIHSVRIIIDKSTPILVLTLKEEI
jgi:hypothetical protein